MSIVEIRTTRVGEGKSRRTVRQVIVDGHDISADVLSVDVHMDSKGNGIATVTLIAAVVETESAAVELCEETKLGLEAMGWRSMPTIQKAILEALNDLEDNTNEADGRLDFSTAQTIVSAALADLEKEPTP